MKQYTYLLVDFFTIIVPFIFSFHPRLNFQKTWRAFFPAVLVTGTLFVIWDVYFTHLGVWGFNTDYLLGSYLWGLPVEELLFFFCIPYSCVFTYHCLMLLASPEMGKAAENIITWILVILGLVAGFIFIGQRYTCATAFLMSVLLLFAKHLLKVRWLGSFYLVYLVLLVPFCIVNGILTGTGLDSPVVWYNEAEIIGVRILTIPLEDVFYGLDLILINLLIYNYLKGRFSLASSN